MATKEANHDPTGCTSNDLNIAARGRIVAVDRVVGHENGQRARRDEVRVDAIAGGGGSY